MSRPLYFGAGPACLPKVVLNSLKSDLLNWHDTQLSILEVGHRSQPFEQTLFELEALCRRLLQIPENYHVFFVGMPTRAHFDLIPMHFLPKHKTAGYWVTGEWSEMAMSEAAKNHSVFEIARAAHALPKRSDWKLSPEMAYAYFTPNETIAGVRFLPELSEVTCPIIADMTSFILTERFDISQYAMIIAGMQKNMGIAGMSMVIIEDAFLATSASAPVPTYLNYQTYANAHSLCVTPPTFNCEVALQVLRWMEEEGGVTTFTSLNQAKAQRLYAYLDASVFYETFVQGDARSNVNVTFRLAKPELTETFLEQAKANQLLGLAGHRKQGGLRASMYNAMPLSGIEKLIDFLSYFEQQMRG